MCWRQRFLWCPDLTLPKWISLALLIRLPRTNRTNVHTVEARCMLAADFVSGVCSKPGLPEMKTLAARISTRSLPKLNNDVNRPRTGRCANDDEMVPITARGNSGARHADFKAGIRRQLSADLRRKRPRDRADALLVRNERDPRVKSGLTKRKKR